MVSVHQIPSQTHMQAGDMSRNNFSGNVVEVLGESPGDLGENPELSP